MKRYYFDYAAATPVDPAVEKAMRPYWSEIYGNPGALHWFGQEASAAVFAARDRAAKILGCHYKEIIFTGSATEANNLALRGVIKGLGFRVEGKEKNNQSKNLTPNPSTLYPKVIISAIEHESVLETAEDLKKEGVEVVHLPVTEKGIVDLKKLKSLLDERTILVSVMYANNEIGTIQPISKILEMIQNFRNEHLAFSVQHKGGNKNTLNANRYPLYPLFHTDAVQAFNYLDCNVQKLGVDLMTLSSQKIYGPKGIGLLYQRSAFSAQRIGEQKNIKILNANRFTLSPIITGGGQEFGLRGGTEAVPLIMGFVKAMEIADRRRVEETKKIKKLQEYFWSKIKKIISAVELNGNLESRLPNNLNIYFPGNAGQDLLIKLDLAGFAVSPGAACSARICQPSHVLMALGYSDARATGSLRITFGRQTTKQEIDKLLEALKRNLA